MHAEAETYFLYRSERHFDFYTYRTNNLFNLWMAVIAHPS